LNRESSDEQNEQLSETVSAIKQTSLGNDTKAFLLQILNNSTDKNSV